MQSGPPTCPPTLEDTESQASAEALAAGTRLGPWCVGQMVGRGGMGEVYEARRADGAFELRVAIKLLKRGLDSDAIVARFTRERRILAQLDHPNIAHVLDAGVSADGRPFMAMEYVDGQSLTDYVRAHQLPTAAVLRLMITACDAVQAAHAKHIVHRDLKPSNVMVSNTGQVKLLDFGIAKALAEEDADATRLAGEAMALTPAYAAPEQLLGLAVSPASDVYALGVMLYQLLVERLPHQRAGRSTHDIARGLDGETLLRPSTALRRERGRQPEPQRQERLQAASRDLDLVVLKALHADALHRYATAQELGDDLQRLIAHRPVQARPDSKAYRISRFVRRNRVLVSAVAAIIVALSVGLAAALWQAHVALLARNEATERRQQADDLINFMLGNLKDRLQPVGRLDVLDAVTAKVLNYLEQGANKNVDNVARAQTIKALVAVATLQDTRGQLPEAIETAQQSVAAAQELSRLQPQSIDGDFLLASAYLALAVPLLDSNRKDEALALAQADTPLIAKVLSARPDDASAVQVAAGLHSLSGDIHLSQRDFAQSLKEYRACADAMRPLVHKVDRGQDQDHDHDGAVSVVKSDDWLLYFGCRGSAVSSFLRINAIDEAVANALELIAEESAAVDRDPRNTILLGALLADLSSAIGTFAMAGHIEQAQDFSRRALDLGHRLVAGDPSNVLWKVDLGIALWNQCRLETVREDWPALEKAADEEIDIQQGVQRSSPDFIRIRASIAAAHFHRALASACQHKVEAALADVDVVAALAATDASTELQFLALDAHLAALELLVDIDSARAHTERAATERAAAGQLIDRLAADPALTTYLSNCLKAEQMQFAYLSGDVTAGDGYYAELRRIKPFDLVLTTQARQALCTPRARRAGPPCAT